MLATRACGSAQPLWLSRSPWRRWPVRNAWCGFEGLRLVAETSARSWARSLAPASVNQGGCAGAASAWGRLPTLSLRRKGFCAACRCRPSSGTGGSHAHTGVNRTGTNSIKSKHNVTRIRHRMDPCRIISGDTRRADHDAVRGHYCISFARFTGRHAPVSGRRCCTPSTRSTLLFAPLHSGRGGGCQSWNKALQEIAQ